MQSVQVRARTLTLAIAVSLVSLSSTGCVERRYTIRTEPPGALVYINDEELGPSPVSRQFYYYGPRKVTIVADGYQTQTLIQPVKAPWWDNYLTEFFTENLVPVTLRDEREFAYQLTPKTAPPADNLIDRAEELRAQGQATPPPRRGGLFGWLGF